MPVNFMYDHIRSYCQYIYILIYNFRIEIKVYSLILLQIHSHTEYWSHCRKIESTYGGSLHSTSYPMPMGAELSKMTEDSILYMQSFWPYPKPANLKTIDIWGQIIPWHGRGREGSVRMSAAPCLPPCMSGSHTYTPQS